MNSRLLQEAVSERDFPRARAAEGGWLIPVVLWSTLFLSCCLGVRDYRSRSYVVVWFYTKRACRRVGGQGRKEP